MEEVFKLIGEATYTLNNAVDNCVFLLQRYSEVLQKR